MRTKEEIAKILAKRKTAEALTASTWSNLVASIQKFTPEERAIFVKLIAYGNAKNAGERLKQALYVNAQERAKAEVDVILSDDSLSMEELDSLL